MIVKFRGSKWIIKSDDGKTVLGEFNTRKEAIKQLAILKKGKP